MGGNDSVGYAINDLGQITGHAQTAALGANEHAFIYTNGSMADLQTLGGVFSVGYAINNAGQVAGTSDLAGQTAQHAFVYANGKMNDLGTLGGTNSFAFGINTAGQITGASDLGTTRYAFLYANGRMQNLGTLPGGTQSDGFAINTRGDIVGFATGGSLGNKCCAFLYHNGAMYNLNSLIDPSSPLASHVSLVQAAGINDNGWIVADGYDSQANRYDTYMLQPILPPVNDLLAALLAEVIGVGPGKSLANKVMSAQTYYAVPDIQSTCAVLTGFVNEVKARAGKKIAQPLDARLVAAAEAIEVAIGCN